MLTAVALLAELSTFRSTSVRAESVESSASSPQSAQRCTGLADLHIDQVEIVSARNQAAGTPVAGATLRVPGMGASAEISGLPGFCRVIGRIQAEAGSAINFEVWMPSDGWDGRLNGIGVGGFAGSISYRELSLAVRSGQVGVTTDTGHRGTYADGAWAKGHPERVRDYGWRAFHLTTLAAKKLVASYYGRGPDRSYFIGCSGGGRQGLIEAARFPEDYDGVLAGAPAANFTDLAMSMVWTAQMQMEPGAQIRPSQTDFLQSEVLKQCDALDGQVDGVVDDPRQCKFDASKLACGTSSSPQCFTPPQIIALNRIYDGPRDATGHPIAPAYGPSGSEQGDAMLPVGWENGIFGTTERPSAHSLFAHHLLQSFIAAPFANVGNFDFNSHPARIKATLAADLDASPDLRRFFARGGKLILWHGWADGFIPPNATLNYHQALLRISGKRAPGSARLFMVPGVQHCSGGSGPAIFGQSGAPAPGETPDRNMLAALQAWVEKGRPPDSLVARKGSVTAMMGGPTADKEMQRLLCAFPARAVLRAGANPDEAASYNCSLPGK
jgi:feruloyl esterase